MILPSAPISKSEIMFVKPKPVSNPKRLSDLYLSVNVHEAGIWWMLVRNILSLPGCAALLSAILAMARLALLLTSSGWLER